MTSQNEFLAAAEHIEGEIWEVINADVNECTAEAERRMEKGFLDGAMMLRERGLLFEEEGDMGVWNQEREGNEERKQKVERIVRIVMEKVKENKGADCGCG